MSVKNAVVSVLEKLIIYDLPSGSIDYRLQLTESIWVLSYVLQS